VRSHFRGETTAERIYAAGNAIAEWLGYRCWIDVAVMQQPESVDEFRRRLDEAE